MQVTGCMLGTAGNLQPITISANFPNFPYIWFIHFINMRIFFIVLLATLSIFSCKKKDLKFTINGVVSDVTFNTLASEVEVRLYVKPLGESKKLVASAFTSSDGFFEFVIDRERIELVELEYQQENYFDESIEINFSDLQANVDNDASQSITAKSWVRFNIRNQPPSSASDEFKLFKYRGKEDCSECCPVGYSFYYGAIDTAVICANNANSYTSFFYWVIDTQINGQDSVYTTPFDTVEYNFVY